MERERKKPEDVEDTRKGVSRTPPPRLQRTPLQDVASREQTLEPEKKAVRRSSRQTRRETGGGGGGNLT